MGRTLYYAVYDELDRYREARKDIRIVQELLIDRCTWTSEWPALRLIDGHRAEAPEAVVAPGCSRHLAGVEKPSSRSRTPCERAARRVIRRTRMERSRFRDVLVQRVRAQATLIGAFTTHRTLTGSARERAIVQVLREMLPRRFEALTGTIAAFGPDGQLLNSDRQIDLMVVDTWLYPTLFRDGETAVVFADAVRAVVEIKTSTVGTWAWVDALTQSAALGDAVDPESQIPRAVFAYETGGYEELAAALRILNWSRTQQTAAGDLAFKPLVKRGRAKARAQGRPRVLRPSLLRPVLLPRLIVGGSGVLGVRLKTGDAEDWRFQVTGPGAVTREVRGRDIELQVARLLEFLLSAARDSAPSSGTHRVHQQLRGVIDGGADLPAGAMIDMNEGTPDVLDPTTEATRAGTEELA
ncbi:MAG: hypothetical protein JWM10_765 [Myxococcaceae bacterium]|nr:hypothetical protein [Myxococcaceae bacterium]